jgi:hypothetical protein
MTPEGRRGLAMIPEGFDSWVYTGVHTPGDVLVPAAVGAGDRTTDIGSPVIGRFGIGYGAPVWWPGWGPKIP